MCAHHIAPYLRINEKDDEREMVPMDAHQGDAGGPQYVISVKGHLDPRWASSFDGMTLTPVGDGTTTIRGPVVDQAALHAVLHKLGDIGIPLISLTRLDTDR